jgi:hypothetical protein
MADTLMSVWGDDALRAKLSKLGLSKAKDFSWQKTAELTLSAYKSIL